MSQPNRRHKQRRTAQLRAEMEGRLENPFGFDETFTAAEQEEIKHLAALVSRIHGSSHLVGAGVDRRRCRVGD